jgi:hypothetical protein
MIIKDLTYYVYRGANKLGLSRSLPTFITNAPTYYNTITSMT